MSTPTPSPTGFPRALLEQPIAARLRYFETKVVAHEQLKQVHADLLHAIRHPAGASLILVFGPTGVGKTTLRQRIERQLIEDASTDPATTAGHIPVVGMEAASPDSGNFSWKDYYMRALMALDEPLLSDKIGYEMRGIHRDDQGRLLIERMLTVPDLRRVLEKCLLHRRPRAFLVDEAQHFKKMTSGRRLLDQMDNLKSLANMTNTVHVLIGTYDLLGLMNLSAQLSRRSIEIHFPRYHAESASDLAEFKKLLRTLQRHLPLPEEPDLEGRYEYFYERSLGCTGMLKTWLNRALAAALEHNASTLTQQLCEQHAEPLQKLKHMIREIREGEQALQENEADTRDLRAYLKLGNDLTPPRDTPLKAEQAAPEPSSPTQPRKGRASSVGNARQSAILWEERTSVPVNGAVLCDLWEGERVEAPPHSRLYHLGPIGVGSPMAESLTSYLTRLAEAHSLHLRTLVTDEILPRLNQSHLYRDNRPVYDHLTRFWKQSATLNGTSATSSAWVQALEQLTLRSDLRFLTMLTFADVLSSRGLLRCTQAWCPACYEQWREADQVIYQPLLWALEVIRVCPHHGLRLQLRCPYADCGQAPSALAPRSQTGFCPKCERWLGNSAPHERTDQWSGVEEQEWQQWVGTAVGELLAAAPEFPAPPHKEVISAAVIAHIQVKENGNFSAFARQLHVHRRTAWEWGQGLQVPQLDTLLKLCSCFKTSPLKFFMGYALETTLVERRAPEEKLTAEKPKKRYRKFETEKLRYALESVMQEEGKPPPSMREVARRLQYDSSHLYKHFPDHCRAIAARYRAYQKELRGQRLQRICNEVQETARSLRAQGRSPSERQVGKVLKLRGVLREDEVRTALKTTLLEVGWQQ